MGIAVSMEMKVNTHLGHPIRRRCPAARARSVGPDARVLVRVAGDVGDKLLRGEREEAFSGVLSAVSSSRWCTRLRETAHARHDDAYSQPNILALEADALQVVVRDLIRDLCEKV